jgi:hypothetical protein
MNYGELRDLVKQFLEVDETTFNANFPMFVRLAEEDIERKVQLQDLMETSTSATVPGSPYVSLPPNFLSTYSIAIVVGGEYQFLLTKEHSFIREAYPDPNDTGVPRYYALFDDANMMIAPTPDQFYDIVLNYYYTPPSLSEGEVDLNETWISINGENALLYGTILQGYIYLKGDQDVMKQYMESYAQAISALKVIAEGRNRKDSYRTPDRRLPV